MVTVVGIEVTGDNVLEVSVLPVQVTGLNGPCEHSPVGAHLCRRGGREAEVRKHLMPSYGERKAGRDHHLAHLHGHLVDSWLKSPCIILLILITC